MSCACSTATHTRTHPPRTVTESVAPLATMVSTNEIDASQPARDAFSRFTSSMSMQGRTEVRNGESNAEAESDLPTDFKVRFRYDGLLELSGVSGLPKAEDLARARGLQCCHLRSKVRASHSSSENSAPSEMHNPVCVARVQELDRCLVLVDGYWRAKNLLATNVQVHAYTVGTLKDALLLRTKLNLDPSRSLSKLEAVRLLLAHFSDEVEEIRARVGAGRGNKQGRGKPNQILADKWNRLGWEPRLSQKDVEAGRGILDSLKDENPGLRALVEARLSSESQSPMALSTFYDVYVKPVNPFASFPEPLDEYCPSICELLDHESVRNYDASLARGEISQKHAGNDPYVQSPTKGVDAECMDVGTIKRIANFLNGDIVGVTFKPRAAEANTSLNSRVVRVSVLVNDNDSHLDMFDSVFEDESQQGRQFFGVLIIEDSKARSGWSTVLIEASRRRLVTFGTSDDALTIVRKLVRNAAGTEWRYQRGVQQVLSYTPVVLATCLVLGAQPPKDIKSRDVVNTNASLYSKGGLGNLFDLHQKSQLLQLTYPYNDMEPVLPSIELEDSSEYEVETEQIQIAGTPASEQFLASRPRLPWKPRKARRKTPCNNLSNPLKRKHAVLRSTEALLERATVEQMCSAATSLTAILDRRIPEISVGRAKAILASLAELVVQVSTKATVKEATSALSRIRQQSTSATKKRRRIVSDEMECPASWLCVEGPDAIKEILERLSPSASTSVRNAIRHTSKLYCRISKENTLRPWTLVAMSNIAFDDDDYDDGLYFVGQSPLQQNEVVGYFDGRQLAYDLAAEEDQSSAEIALEKRITCEKFVVTCERPPRIEEWLDEAKLEWKLKDEPLLNSMLVAVDGKEGVCGGMQKMNSCAHLNDSIHNVRFDPSGFCKTTSVVQPGDELTVEYNIDKQQRAASGSQALRRSSCSDDDDYEDETEDNENETEHLHLESLQ